MRIALIGDLQYWMPEEENLAYKMGQVAKLEPDFAVVMGDFGGSKMRSAAGLEETRRHVEMIGCPWHAIFGNHDVEYAPDNINAYDPTATFRDVFEKEPYFAMEVNGVLILCITIERQPLEGMRTIHAVYVSDAQFAWAEDQLRAHTDMPTILITHAPMIGSGLRCDRPLHSAALDTYLDQTYKCERWPELLKRFPQIKVWCSAHYHLGHDYDTAMTEKDGVVHISCGVMTCCSRDERKHTRILDITDDKKLIVSTLDHNNDAELIRDAVIDLTGNEAPRGNIAPYIYGEMLLGKDEPEKIRYCEELGRYYISTANGLLWEFLCEFNEFSGALSLKEKVTELAIDGDRLCLGYENKTFASVDLHSRMRWDWNNLLSQERREEISLCGTPLPTVNFTTRTSKEGVYVKFIH